MTSRLVSVSAIGMNRIGTLSRYFNNIYKNNGNVQESTLHNVNDIFIMNAQLQFPKSQNINFLYPDFYNFQKESNQEAFYGDLFKISLVETNLDLKKHNIYY